MKDAKTDPVSSWGTRGGKVLGIVLGLALAVGPAFGQAGAQAPRPTGSAAGLPSESTAAVLAVIGTAAAVFLPWHIGGWAGLGVLCAGPSLGFFYAGCWSRGLLSTAVRLGGTFLLATALLDDDTNAAGWAYGWLGGMAATAILDIVTVRKAVRRRNATVARRRGLALDVSPFVVPKGAGVQVRLGF
jgi:hypothetical protein